MEQNAVAVVNPLAAHSELGVAVTIVPHKDVEALALSQMSQSAADLIADNLMRQSISDQQDTSALFDPADRRFKKFSTAFVFLVARIFTTLATVYTLALLALTILYAFRDYQHIPRQPAVQLFFLLAGSIETFALFWMVCYAPSKQMLSIVYVNAVVALASGAVYTYMTFSDFFAVVVLAVFGVACIIFLSVVKHVYNFWTILPIEEHTVEIWLTFFRLYVVVAAPVAANFIRSGGASTIIPYYAVFSFQVIGGFLLCVLRIMFGLDTKSKSVAATFQNLNAVQLAKLYGGIVLMLLVFGALYLIVISDSDTAVPQSVTIVLLVIFGAGLMSIMLFAFSAVTRWKSLRFFAVFTDEQFAALTLAQALGRRHRQLLTSFADKDV